MLTLQNQNLNELALVPEDNDIVSAKIVANDLKIRLETVYRWADRGILPVYRINIRCLRFSRREVREAIARYRVKKREVAP
jgi:hypothetical protein